MSEINRNKAEQAFNALGAAVEFTKDEADHLAMADAMNADGLPAFVVSVTVSSLMARKELDDLHVDERLACAERVMLLARREDGESLAEVWNAQHVRIIRAVIRDWQLPDEWFRKTARILGGVWASEDRPPRPAVH